MVPELRRQSLLMHRLPGTSDEHAAFARVLMDSLIRLRAVLPSDEIEALYGVYPAGAAILLSYDPQSNTELLLKLAAKTPHNEVWLTLSNLLADRRAPGFAAHLLRLFEMQLDITVTDSDLPGVNAGPCGGAIFGSIAVDPPGFPPVWIYALTTFPQRGDVLVTHGPQDVYYRRWRTKITTIPANGSSVDLYRHRYIAYLIDRKPEDLPIQHREWRTIHFTTVGQYRSDLDALIDNRKAAYASVVDELHQRGLLTPEEATSLTPNIRINVHDLRKDQSIPLPILK